MYYNNNIYIYIYMYTSVYIYIYMYYRERERDNCYIFEPPHFKILTMRIGQEVNCAQHHAFACALTEYLLVVG